MSYEMKLWAFGAGMATFSIVGLFFVAYLHLAP